jgi:hypothetical protein
VVDEVGIFAGHLLQFLGDIQQRIVCMDSRSSVAHFFHDFGAGVVGLVYPVPESHEPERVFLSLGPVDGFLEIAAVGLDMGEHLDDRLVGTAVQGPPQGGDARRDGGVEVDPGAAHHAHGRGGAVLFMVGMQDPEHAQGIDRVARLIS